MMKMDQFFLNDEVDSLLESGLAVHGEKGGLVKGITHEEGGIYLLKNVGHGYKLVAQVEAWQYILTVACSWMLRAEWPIINDIKADEMNPFEPYQPGENILIIDATTKPGSKYPSKFILLDGRGHQAVINKHSTKAKLSYIDAINRSYEGTYNSDLFFHSKELTIRHLPSNEIMDVCSVTPDI